ncbi:MAG: hypothetical protein KBS44_03680 [Clostridiales bacterium]|nr:hypothetical protein [Candidatus Coliplasma equi]
MQLIVGVKGTGKTKAIIEEVNKAAVESKGVVICIEYGRKLAADIKYHTRLVDAKEYGVDCAGKLYGFVCGMLASNYDITDLFIDSALKICKDDIPAFEKFVCDIEKIAASANVNIVMTASVEPSLLSSAVDGFIRK